jgi:hypothetical protein|tara:strand:+ start:3478 stop:3678 length:201 start_codon:yes stop_codon:yes gene_type:complete
MIKPDEITVKKTVTLTREQVIEIVCDHLVSIDVLSEMPMLNLVDITSTVMDKDGMMITVEKEGNLL